MGMAIKDFKILKKSNKVNGDHTSKIIAKFLEMYNKSVNLGQIISGLEH